MIMLRNIVGVFDQNDAQQVRAALLQNGFPESDIHVTASDTAYGSSVDTTRDVRDDDRHEGGIMGFFKDLFGMDDRDEDTSRYAASYSDAVRRGNTVVAVTVDNDDEIEKVENIMESYHAIDIDENAQGWQDNTGMRTTDTMTENASDLRATNIDALTGTGMTRDRSTDYSSDTMRPGVMTDRMDMADNEPGLGQRPDVVPGNTTGSLPDRGANVSGRNIDTLDANDNMKADYRDTNADYPSDTVRTSDQAYVAGTTPLNDSPTFTDRGDDRNVFEKATDKVKAAFDRTADRTEAAFDRTTDRTEAAFDRTTDRTDTMFDRTVDRTDANWDRTQDKAVLPVVKESLDIGKRVVQRGGVRIFSKVNERPVEENIELREERAVVERHPADRPATEADLAALKEGQIELRNTAEEAVVNKTARVVEEVVVGKQADQRTETVRDTVRDTDVRVENLGDTNVTRDADLTRDTRLASDTDLDRDLTRDTDLTRDRDVIRDRDLDKGNRNLP